MCSVSKCRKSRSNRPTVTIGANLQSGILGDAGTDPEGLVGGEGWRYEEGVPLSPGEGSGECATPHPQKNFLIEIACIGEF